MSSNNIIEPPHDKTNKMTVRPAKTPPSLIRVFAVRMKKAWVLRYPLSALWRLRSDWADAQADLSLRWAHSHFVGFATRRLICFYGELRNLSWTNHRVFLFLSTKKGVIQGAGGAGSCSLFLTIICLSNLNRRNCKCLSEYICWSKPQSKAIQPLYTRSQVVPE